MYVRMRDREMQVVSRQLLFLVLVVVVSIENLEACEEGDIRLAGGPNEFEGRLEYCRNSTWGHVCGTAWSRTNTLVACTQLGFVFGDASQSSISEHVDAMIFYGAQEGPAFVDQVECSPSDNALSECSKTELDATDGCSNQGGFVYLLCQDPSCEGKPDSVQLVGGVSENSGRVEVCDSLGRRRQVCENGWDDQDASVVCRALGFQDGTGVIGYDLTSLQLPAYTTVDCLGTEESFIECNLSVVRLFLVDGDCDGFAGVNCSGPPPTTSTPALLPSSTGTNVGATLPPLASTNSVVPSVSITAATLFIPTPTVLPPPPGESSNMLLIAIIGGVGGAIGVLLLLVVILFLIILLRRNGSSDKYNISPENNESTGVAGSMSRNGHLNLPPIPLDTLENSIKEEFQTPTSSPLRHRTSSEYDHVLLNPLYAQKNRSRSNTIISDQSSVFEDLGYSEIKGLTWKSSSLDRTLNGKLEISRVPSDTPSQRSHSPRFSHSKTPSNLSSQPYLDEQGYAALEGGGAHVYDEMQATHHTYDDVNTISISIKKTLVPSNELLLFASPYEMPALLSLANASPSTMRGSLLSPEHKFGIARSNPNLHSTPPKVGFSVQSPGMLPADVNIASHEYRELENIATRMYDSPKNVRDSIKEPNGTDYARGYEAPVMVKETAAVMEVIARDYESPVITITGEGMHEYENPDLAMELQRSIELETIPE